MLAVSDDPLPWYEGKKEHQNYHPEVRGPLLVEALGETVTKLVVRLGIPSKKKLLFRTTIKGSRYMSAKNASIFCAAHLKGLMVLQKFF